MAESSFAEARNSSDKYRDWFGQKTIILNCRITWYQGIRSVIGSCWDWQGKMGSEWWPRAMSTTMSGNGTSFKTAWSPSGTARAWKRPTGERKPNSEFYLRPMAELEEPFSTNARRPWQNTLEIAERCTFDLTKDLSYTFPDYPAPEGYTPDSYLEKLCCEAAVRRYGAITPAVSERLEQEFNLIRKYNLAGFLLHVP